MVLLDSINVPFRANQSLQDDGISYRIGMHEWQDVVRVLDQSKIISTKCEPKTKPLKNSNGRKIDNGELACQGVSQSKSSKIILEGVVRSRTTQKLPPLTATLGSYAPYRTFLGLLSSPLIHKSYLFLLFSQDRHRASLNLGPL